MGNPFKGIVKAVKGVVKGVTKIFKSVWKGVKRFVKSKLGKVVLIGAAIWLGGAALGYWNSGFAAIDGSLAATAAPAAAEGAAAGVGSAAQATAAEAATGGLMAPAAASETAATAAAATPAAAEAAIPGVLQGQQLAMGMPGSGATMMAGAPLPAATTPAAAVTPVAAGAPNAAGFIPSIVEPAAATTGLMGKVGGAVTGAAKWMAANPIPTLVGGQMLASALTPDELDLLAEQRRIELEREKEGSKNVAAVANIPGLTYTGASPYPAIPSFLKYPHPSAPVRGLMST